MTTEGATKEERVSPETPQEIPADWKANIIAFCCHYCAFAAADLAGVMRLPYAPNVKIIRMPCTGKLDHSYVLRAFERGIDGVFVAGCLEGQCHFLEGNFNGKKRVHRLQKLLPTVGIDPKRLEFFNLSAAMGPRWAEICSDFTARIEQLGPSPIWRALHGRAAVRPTETEAA
jgi:F420-non-reducing hydrogenase iron-sulfur subunit